MNRISFTLVAASVVTLLGCDGGSSPTPGAKRVLASNVIVRPSSSLQGGHVSAMTVRAAEEGVDPNLKVLAENVEISNMGNALASSNLQSALDNELAVDLTALLPGSTWTIQNRTADATYKGFGGEVSFSADGKMTVSGHFAAAGLVSESVADTFCNFPISATYEVLSNSVLYLSARVKGRTDGSEGDQLVVPIVVSRTKDSITLVGGGGCGALGEDRVSILTRKP